MPGLFCFRGRAPCSAPGAACGHIQCQERHASHAAHVGHSGRDVPFIKARPQLRRPDLIQH